MADTIYFRAASLFCLCFLGDSIIAITLLSPCAITALSTYTLQVRLQSVTDDRYILFFIGSSSNSVLLIYVQLPYSWLFRSTLRCI